MTELINSRKSFTTVFLYIKNLPKYSTFTLKYLYPYEKTLPIPKYFFIKKIIDKTANIQFKRYYLCYSPKKGNRIYNYEFDKITHTRHIV